MTAGEPVDVVASVVIARDSFDSSGTSVEIDAARTPGNAFARPTMFCANEEDRATARIGFARQVDRDRQDLIGEKTGLRRHELVKLRNSRPAPTSKTTAIVTVAVTSTC